MAGTWAAVAPRFSSDVPARGAAFYRNADGLFRRLAELGMFVQIQVAGPQLVGEMARLLASGAQILIDHCGRPDLAMGGKPTRLTGVCAAFRRPV